MSTAFVLSGGGSLGAVQVGMLQALAEQGVRPDLLVGTSVGALNAAWVADRGMGSDSLNELSAVWTQLRRGTVFPADVRQVVRGLLGLSRALCSNGRLQELVSAHVGFSAVEEAAIPLHLVCADLMSGEDVLVSDGPVVSGVVASAAVPGVFPPVERDGRLLVDGALAPRTGISQAVELGASEIYVLPTGSPCALVEPPRSAIGVALHALTQLIEQRLIEDLVELAGRATIKVLPPLCPLKVSAADFGHAAELISRSHDAATRWIADGGTGLPAQERFLSLHTHPAAEPDRAAPARSA
jgi:NTE family protein